MEGGFDGLYYAEDAHYENPFAKYHRRQYTTRREKSNGAPTGMLGTARCGAKRAAEDVDHGSSAPSSDTTGGLCPTFGIRVNRESRSIQFEKRLQKTSCASSILHANVD